MSAGRVARWWRSWVALMDRREAPTALALVRISVALVLVCDYLWVWHVGLIDPLWSRFPEGFATSYSGWADTLDISAHGLWTIALVSLVLVFVGFLTRPACVVFVIVSAQQSAIAPDSESAIDMLLRIVFLILALSRCNARWSIDAWIARLRGTPMPAVVPAWPRYLLLFQLCWVYFSGGQNKSGASWGPHGGFTALGNALLDPHNGRLAEDLVTTVYPVTRVATALTMAFELCGLAYLLWLYYAATPDLPGRLRRWCNKLRLRWIWISLGISFELGIAGGLKLGAFPFGMLALFWVLLLPSEVERLVARTIGRLPRRDGSGEAR
jgi:hypothetical protein